MGLVIHAQIEYEIDVRREVLARFFGQILTRFLARILARFLAMFFGPEKHCTVLLG